MSVWRGCSFIRVPAAWAFGPKAQDVVRIDSGLLKGSTHAGVTSFKGIFVAKPPVVKLRWEPPQPVANERMKAHP